jgi:crotonobetainyl-CoA:carnitine CoA-transferase CaiB-like acyl-CoA transferase
VRHLGVVVPVESPHTAREAVRPAVQFDGRRAGSVRPAPLLGEHDADIRARIAQGGLWPDALPAKADPATAHAL